MQEKDPGPDEPWPVMIMLDEFNRLGKMPIVVESIETLRTYRGHLAVVTQTILALDEIYGENTRRALQGNAGVKLYLTPSDEKTVEELSKAVGKTTKTVVTRSQSIGKNPFEGRSQSTRTEESSLLAEDEAQRPLNAPAPHCFIRVDIPSVCGGCTLWLEPASFTVVETARTEDFGYDYDYDFSIDTPVSSAAILVGSATNDVEIQSFSARSLNARPSPEWFAEQTQTFSEERRFLRLQGVQTFDDLTCQLDIYVHPDGLNLESLSREQRLQYLVRTKTIWRSHHGLTAENLANDGHEMHSRTSVLVDLSEQTEALEKDQWTISVIAESMPNVPTGTSNNDEQKAQEDLRLEDLDGLIDAL